MAAHEVAIHLKLVILAGGGEFSELGDQRFVRGINQWRELSDFRIDKIGVEHQAPADMAMDPPGFEGGGIDGLASITKTERSGRGIGLFGSGALWAGGGGSGRLWHESLGERRRGENPHRNPKAGNSQGRSLEQGR